jgi:predicted phosphodiesterase
MKVITIGDIHGRPFWKSVNPDLYDLIIFTADFVDSYDYSNHETYTNLQDIITFKRKYFDKVFLLFGNHDIQYVFTDSIYRCSGFRAEMALDLNELFNKNKDCFQIAYQKDNYLWTHAGVTNGWYKRHQALIEDYSTKFETKNLAETLNIILWTNDNPILHEVSDYRGGYLEFGGITWADRNETIKGHLKGYHQIVGHTPIKEITTYGDENESITYIDVQKNVNKFKYDELNIEKTFLRKRNMKFWLTQHSKERYVERILNGLNNVDNLNITILKEINAGIDVTNKIYDEVPRYILFLYEKYKELGLKIIRSKNVLFITKKRKGTNELYDVLTCYFEDGNYLRQFKNSILSREDIFIKIKLIKAKLK